MWVARTTRAWLLSTFSCVVLLGCWVVVMQLLSGRLDHLFKNVLGFSLAFGSVFALVAGLLYIPTFVVLNVVLGKLLTRLVAAVIGAALSPLVYLAVAWQFGEAEDPESVAAWLLYWKSHMSEFMIGMLPFASAGALFGWFWMWPPSNERLEMSGVEAPQKLHG